MGSVGGGSSTNSKFIKSKQAKYEFRGTERIHGFGSNSANIFSQKREGSKPPFFKIRFLFCSSPDEKLSVPSPSEEILISKSSTATLGGLDNPKSARLVRITLLH